MDTQDFVWAWAHFIPQSQQVLTLFVLPLWAVSLNFMQMYSFPAMCLGTILLPALLSVEEEVEDVRS